MLALPPLAAHSDRATFVARRAEIGIMNPGVAALLHCLLGSVGKTMARTALVQALDLTERSVSSYASILRAELARFGLAECLETVRGNGYRITFQGAERIAQSIGLELSCDVHRVPRKMHPAQSQ